jgi:ribose transport system permease protein
MSALDDAAGRVAVEPAGGRRFGLAFVRDFAIAFSVATLFVVLSISSSDFLTVTNLTNILDQWAPVAIVACAATLVIIAGGFDLSVGAIYALSGVLAALVANSTSPVLGILVGVLAGVALGVGNGVLATAGRVNSFIATLATSIIIRGIAVAATGGFLVTVIDPSYTDLGRGSILGVKTSVWLLVIFAAATWFLLSQTTFGRFMFASGGNEEAARLSGVRVDVVRAATFAISGLAAGIAGVLVSSRVATGEADSGVGLELQAIAAVVIGGTSISGGEGAVWRTILGVLLLALIGNGFNLLNVDPTYQQIFQGTIILIAVSMDAWTRRTRA